MSSFEGVTVGSIFVSRQELDKLLDRVKLKVFLGSNSAFLGSVMCSLDFEWDEKTKTAATDFLKIYWNPTWFLELSQEERVTVLVHEIWHVALMHQLREGSRCHDVWNVACDYRINNNLIADKYVMPKNGTFNPALDAQGILAEEQIYDLLMKNAIPMPTNPMNDLRPMSSGKQVEVKAKENQIIGAVVRAVQAAQLAGQAGTLPGSLKDVLNTFLDPVVDWRAELQQWATDLLDEDYTWKRPSRRHQDIYLPSRYQDEGRLDHLVYLQDTSGSISQEDMDRFNSEVKYIWESLQPKKLTLVQFDAKIQYVREFNEGDTFEDLEIHGGGGTRWAPVRAWIEKNRPTAAVLFTDMCFNDPVTPPKEDIPVLWAVIHNPKAKAPFGRITYIKD